MTEDLKDRPAILRRTPRPAPDEKVDPVDYSPAAVVPVPAPAPAAEPAPVSGGAELAPAPAPAPAVIAPAPARQTSRTTKASKPAPNRKTSRREVTFPLSTRLSEEVLDILYAAAEEEGISVREAIEQSIKSRWG